MRVWGKGNTSVLLLGIHIGTATMENRMEFFSKKLKIELPFDPTIPLPRIYLKEIKTECQKISTT